MLPRPFALERHFAAHEFSAPYLFSASDCEPLSLERLLALADPETTGMWKDLRLGYTDSQGLPALRREIARLYVNVSPEDVVVVVPEEGIFLAMHALLHADDHVVTTFPGYQSLYEFARDIGCAVDQWRPSEENGWRFDPASLERLARPNTRLLVMNFPHNPTGYLPSCGEFRAVLAWANARGIRVFSDEMYRLLELDPADRLPSAADGDDRAITLFGMSKAFGLAGLRIGWLVIRDRNALQRVVALKDYTTICASAPAELLALIGLRARDAIVSEHLARIGRNVALLDRFLADHPGFATCVLPRAGSVCFPRLTSREGTSAFCRRIVEQAGVMIVPSAVYDFGDEHFRIALGRENFPEVLGRFEQFATR